MPSYTFIPPSIAEVPPIGSTTDDRFGRRLMRFYKPRQRGVAVFKLTDDSYRVARQVPGLNVPVLEPYPATTPDQFPQLASPLIMHEAADNSVEGTMVIATSYDATTNVYTQFDAQQPQIELIYYGGHIYLVNNTEATALTAAGFGAYLTQILAGPPANWDTGQWDFSNWS